MIPSGIIVIWYGSVETIPPGWVHCDGSNGTPNIRNKFVIGVGTEFTHKDIHGHYIHDHALSGEVHSHNFKSGYGLQAGMHYSTSLQTSQPDGYTDVKDNAPPYKAMVYIMKL
jgi:hypothetical protein